MNTVRRLTRGTFGRKRRVFDTRCQSGSMKSDGWSIRRRRVWYVLRTQSTFVDMSSSVVNRVSASKSGRWVPIVSSPAIRSMEG